MDDRFEAYIATLPDNPESPAEMAVALNANTIREQQKEIRRLSAELAKAKRKEKP